MRLARFVPVHLAMCSAALLFACMVQAKPSVDINHASADTLITLKGIGPRKAAAIIEEREAHGLYSDARDLTRVKGIGIALADQLKDQLVFQRP